MDDGENWEILTEPPAYEGVLEAVKKAGITPARRASRMIPEPTSSWKGSRRRK